MVNIYNSDSDADHPIFDTCERASTEVIDAMAREVAEDGFLRRILETVPLVTFVLSPERQIVAGNGRFRELLQLTAPEHYLGRRFGEAARCVQVAGAPDGCGTGAGCPYCGAYQAVLGSRSLHEPISGECRMTRGGPPWECLEFNVQAVPFMLGTRDLTVVYMRDISSEKRRHVLERVFFHDVLNSAGGVLGLASMLVEEAEGGYEADPDFERETRTLLLRMTRNLVSEIKDQRDLLAAESGRLHVRPSEVRVMALLREIAEVYARHETARDRVLRVEDGPEVVIWTDENLLRRVLINLVKNALEAVSAGETVTLRHEAHGDQVVFLVHNPGVMPSDVQMQLFHRSFSTKGASGRGIGTYSIKLFGEQFLSGKVSFSSREPVGTTFALAIPRFLPES